MEYQSTTSLAKKLKIDRDMLFKKLETCCYIGRENGKWKLLAKGIEAGGQIRTGVNSETGEQYEYIGWSEKIYKEQEIFTASDVDKLTKDQESESEGEDYIAEYFDKIGLKYREQEFVKNGIKLDGDFENHRRADFYLPDYGIYVEFAGRWNRSDEERERYNFKKHLYINNNVPCIWIYPDNLGVLHYFFHKRLETVLGKHHLENQLLKYRIKEFWKKDSDNTVGLAIGLIFVFYFAESYSLSNSTFLIGIGIVSYNTYKLVNDLYAIYKGKTVEVSRLNSWDDV